MQTPDIQIDPASKVAYMDRSLVTIAEHDGARTSIGEIIARGSRRWTTPDLAVYGDRRRIDHQHRRGGKDGE